MTFLEGAHNFVVVQARAGIYTITAGAKETASNATFLLKLFEGGPREATRKIGTLKVDEKVVVVKILMPDGIIWDDEAAFTGSLEDSDSITKFNSDTGHYRAGGGYRCRSEMPGDGTSLDPNVFKSANMQNTMK